jgi:menaquinone-9 beta-reductase
VTTRLVIGADGLNSRVRRWAGLEGGRGGFHRLGARRHFQITPWSNHVEVIHGLGIEAYITPCGNNLVGVAFLWDATRFRGARGGPALIPSLLRAFPELSERLERVPAASPPLSTGPLHRLARRRSSDGVILVGDAGGYLDACTGEGLSLAFAQALALEQTVVPLLRQGGDVPRREQLADYERACRNITRPYLLATHVLLYLGRHPALLDRFIRAVHHEPDILQHVFSAQMGQVSFWPGWSKLLRLAWGLGRARSQAAGRLR